jgi:hypothetical protein
VRASAALVLAALGCGGAPTPPPADPAAPAPPGPGAPSELDRRRDAACGVLGPRLTACAVDDAKADFAAGKIDRAQLDADTAPAIQAKHTAKFLETCRGARTSSRQVRVLEVCGQQETQCAPLLACLDHLNDGAGAGSARPR